MEKITACDCLYQCPSIRREITVHDIRTNIGFLAVWEKDVDKGRSGEVGIPPWSSS